MTAEDRLDPAFATYNFSVTDFETLCGTVVDPAAFPAAPSLREALIYANHMPGPDTITFAPELSGQTITVSVDGPDEGEEVDPLPDLCGGDLTLNGDIDGDGTSDITLDGSNFSPASTLNWAFYIDSDNNTITSLTLRSFPSPILVGAGVRAAAVTGNRITNNMIDGGGTAIFVFAGFVMQGTTQDTGVHRSNRIRGAAPRGFLLLSTGIAGATPVSPLLG